MAFVQLNDTIFHFRLSGAMDGTPLVLVNSLGTDLQIWDDVLLHLGPTYRVLAYDKRGHGLSDTPSCHYSLDNHAGDLIALARHAGFNRFAICGVSIGGMIAMRVAAKHPQKVLALVLCDTAYAIGTAASWNERISTVESSGVAAISEAIVERWVSPGYRTRRPADFAGWRNMVERCQKDGYVANCVTVRDANLFNELGLIAAPTLVLAGEHDVPTPPPLVRELSQHIKNSHFELIKDAGHVPLLEQPEVLARHIRTHLKGTCYE